jgi:hypothetical protein
MHRFVLLSLSLKLKHASRLALLIIKIRVLVISPVVIAIIPALYIGTCTLTKAVVPFIQNAADSLHRHENVVRGAVCMYYVYMQHVTTLSISMAMAVLAPHLFCYGPLPAATGALAAMVSAGPAHASRNTPTRKPPAYQAARFLYCSLS